MGTAFLAALEHLTKIGKLTESERGLVRAEALRRSGFDA
jgi:hypothetical protein